MGPFVRDTYLENTELCRMLIRTGFSCCGALFTMVIIPGVDAILGKEPEVQNESLFPKHARRNWVDVFAIANACPSAQLFQHS